MTPDEERSCLWAMVVWVYTVLAAVILLYLTCMDFAHASPNTPDECHLLAIDAFNFAQWRDQGVPEFKALRIARVNGTQLIGRDDTYIRNSDDVDHVLELIHHIYQSTKNPAELSIQAYAACLAIGHGTSWKST